MRPIRVVMSAFGPYANVIEIPLSDFGNKGLYLVTGDTGAGKTTIFDAISFGLYGEASGTIRDGFMFRSDYASSDVETYVELDFEYKGEVYKIKRNPQYERQKRRGDGTVKENANASLINPDGKVITGAKQVTTAVEQLLGIDKNQFSQIVMIAQGDFLKLLLADTRTRSDIFRRIFNTSFYQKFQFQLKDKAKELRGEYEDLRKGILQYVDGLKCEEDHAKFVLFMYIISNRSIHEIQEIIDLMESIIEDDEVTIQGLDKETQRILKELETLNQSIGQIQKIEEARLSLTQKQEYIDANKPVLEQLEAEYNSKKEQQPVIERLQAEIAEAEGKLPDYDALEQSMKTTLLLDQDRNKKEQSHTQQKELSDRLNQQILKQKEEKEKIAIAEIEYLKVKSQVKDAILQSEKIEEALAAAKEYKKNNEKMESMQLEFIDSEKELNYKTQEYNELERIFLREQAGLLAENLQDGQACPVCGSLEHPMLAEKHDDAPSEAELKSAKENLEKARLETNKLSHKAGEQKVLADTSSEKLNEKLNAVFSKIIDSKSVETLLDEEQKKAAAEKSSLQTKEKELLALVNQKETNESDIQKSEEQLTKVKDTIEKIAGEVAEIDKNLAAEKGKLETITGKLAFPDREAAIADIRLKKQSKEQLQEAITTAELQWKTLNDNLNVEARAIEALKQQTGSAEQDKPLGELTSERDLLSESHAVYSGKRGKAKARVDVNREILSNINDKRKNMAKKENEYICYKNLSETANGELSGKQKLAFEQYIQATYFEQIIAEANKRFAYMTSNQFELVRQAEASDQRSQTGLELNVHDYFTGKDRSVKTLSGGESFKASLALALGLSDVIQRTAGGIQIDAMFVDEGFGSLDTESLEQAMKILNDLTEGKRLVGIISHVAELRERIDKKIIVSKGISGSNLRLEN